jgi:hypothetical protein
MLERKIKHRQEAPREIGKNAAVKYCPSCGQRFPAGELHGEYWDLAEALAEIWSKEHTGPGHGKATPQQASRARAKYDQIAARKANP